MPTANPTISAPRVHLHVAASEEWRPVAIDPRYMVSDRGRVMGRYGKILAQGLNSCGYNLVGLTGRGRLLVHRLVALAFLGDPPEGCTDVDHLDCDKTNNDVRNLQWTTHQENMRRARAAGRWDENGRRGESIPNAKLTEDDVREIRVRLARWETHRSIAADFGVSSPTITYIATGKTWAHVE